MCLIITGSSKKVRATLLNTPDMLSEIYKSNSDGIGYMYGTSTGLKVVKKLPNTLQEARDFITRMPNDKRDIAIHFRMTTHGHTDLDNCHPYDVVPGYMAMMHNGILQTGNKADTSKSDTFHFIKDFLASPLKSYPDLAYDISFLNLVAEYIGGNRFVFMNGEGRMSHVNFDQGIEYGDMWFSNTYAWRPGSLIPDYKYPKIYGYDRYDDDYGYDNTKHSTGFNSWMNKQGTTTVLGTAPKTTGDTAERETKKPLSLVAGTTSNMTSGLGVVKNVSAHHAAFNEDDYEFPDLKAQIARDTATSFEDFAVSLGKCEVDEVAILIEEEPTYLAEVFNRFRPAASKFNRDGDFSSRDRALIQAILDEDVESLYVFIDHMATGLFQLAEVMCYYIEWTPVEDVPQESALIELTN